jgi:hypothetical protein
MMTMTIDTTIDDDDGAGLENFKASVFLGVQYLLMTWF